MEIVYDTETLIQYFIYFTTAGFGFCVVLCFVCWGISKVVQLFKNIIG